MNRKYAFQTNWLLGHRMRVPLAQSSAAIALALACLAPAHAAENETAPLRHAVLIIVDGLRPDAIPAAGASRIQALAARGSSTIAQAVEIPETLPSLTTVVSGTPPTVHGITWNDDQGREPVGPTIFTQAHAAGLRTALYFGKSKLSILAPRGSATVRFGPGKNAHKERGLIDAVAERFAADFPRERPALALVHLREPDTAGHAHGWMSPQYLAALRAADEAVGTVVRAIETSGVVDATAIYLTADHGGEGDDHRAKDGDTAWLVPLICVVPGRPARPITGAVTLVDVAPTILAWLRLPALPAAQGKPIGACS